MKILFVFFIIGIIGLSSTGFYKIFESSKDYDGNSKELLMLQIEEKQLSIKKLKMELEASISGKEGA